MQYYSNSKFTEEEKRNNAFNLVRALRDSLTLAKRSQQPISYEKTIELLYDLDADLYIQVSQLLKNKNESDTVKYYKQVAKAKSEGLFQYDPVDEIKEDIKKHKELLKNTTSDANDLKFIKKKIAELGAALEYFMPRKISENKILQRDFSFEPKHEFFKKKIYEDDIYKDYELQDKRVLRLRMLHPDKDEHIIGADLIYEYFDLLKEEVRFIHLQYKTWDEQTLYLNQGSIKEQLQKLQTNVCKSGFCKDINGEKNSPGYRLPFCSAFLRPTNKIQNADSTLLSYGDHIPICEILKILEKEPKLTKKNMKNNYLTSNNFLDLFITNMLGSRWMPISTIEKYYEEKDVMCMTNRIRVHAQEVQMYSDEEIQNFKNR